MVAALTLQSTGGAALAARMRKLEAQTRLEMQRLALKRSAEAKQALVKATKRGPDEPPHTHMQDAYQIRPLPLGFEIVSVVPYALTKFDGRKALTIQGKPFLVFKINGHWVKTRQVHQKPRKPDAALVAVRDAEQARTIIAFRRLGQHVTVTFR
jgi:hypothetical protein